MKNGFDQNFCHETSPQTLFKFKNRTRTLYIYQAGRVLPVALAQYPLCIFCHGAKVTTVTMVTMVTKVTKVAKVAKVIITQSGLINRRGT